MSGFDIGSDGSAMLDYQKVNLFKSLCLTLEFVNRM